MIRGIVLLIGGIVALASAPLTAEDGVLGQKYGSGVHAYFDGDYLSAYELLTAAIEGGSNDPRAFYFRGLAFLRLGRPHEAQQDFQTGAARESRDIHKFYNVSKALERIQGQARIELERHRADARMAALEEADRFRRARYEAIQREESRVLRHEAADREQQPAETVAAPAAPEPVKEPAAAEADPFAVEPEKKPAAKKKSTEDDDPFAP